VSQPGSDTTTIAEQLLTGLRLQLPQNRVRMLDQQQLELLRSGGGVPVRLH